MWRQCCRSIRDGVAAPVCISVRLIEEGDNMNNIIYIVGLVVVVLVILSFLGFR